MEIFKALDECKGEDPTNIENGQKDIYVQLVISVALGVSSFIAFCVRLFELFCLLSRN